MSGGSQTSKSVGQSMIDPRMYQSIYGAGAVQPIFNKKGAVKNQAAVDASIAAQGPGGGGLLGQAGELAQQPALNPLQSQALQQSANYLASPQALQGYNALNQAGSALMNWQNPVNLSGMPQVSLSGNAPTVSAANAGGLSGVAPTVSAANAGTLGGSAPQVAGTQAQLAQGGAPSVGGSSASVFNPSSIPTLQAAQGGLANFQAGGPIDWLAIQKSIGQTFTPGGVGGGVSGLGINYQDAANKALSGQVDNPYLTDMAKGAADVATENYLRQVAPAMRSGARQTGMYGSSRQGIAEGLAQSDLNNQILRASTDLFGSAYESAQGRAAQMAGQMAGLDTQRSIANAQLGLQGQIANQDAAIRAGQLGLQTAQGLANYDLGRQGLGLEAAGLAQQGSLANAQMANQVGLGNQDAWLRGAGLAQEGSQFNANLGQQAALANQRTGLDWANMLQSGNLANAQMAQQANLANQAAGLDWAGLGQARDLANAGYAQQAALANQAAGLDWAGLSQARDLANTGYAQQAALANQSAGLDWSRLGQQAQIANQGAFLSGQELGLRGAGMQQDAVLRGAAALQDASQIPFGNLQNLYGIGTTQQMAPWNLLGQYANLLYPQANLGAANRQNQTTEQTIGAGQAALGLGMAALGGMSGLGGLLGGAAGGAASLAPQTMMASGYLNSPIPGLGTAGLQYLPPPNYRF